MSISAASGWRRPNGWLTGRHGQGEGQRAVGIGGEEGDGPAIGGDGTDPVQRKFGPLPQMRRQGAAQAVLADRPPMRATS